MEHLSTAPSTGSLATQQSDIIARVRALPAPGHERRWCAQLPWTKNVTTVRVVDAPAPFRPVEGDPSTHAPREISPAQLAELRTDERITVHIEGEGAGADERAVDKARIDVLERELLDARRAHQTLLEEVQEIRERSQKQLETAAARTVELEGEVSKLRAKLGKPRGKAATAESEE